MTDGSDGGCCGPSRTGTGTAAPGTPRSAAVGGGNTDGMVLLDGGPFDMGDAFGETDPDDGAATVRMVEVGPFWLGSAAVTNDEFSAFVAATGYRTEAECYGWSFVFGGLLPDDFPPTRGVAHAPWWRQVFGADWWHPEGTDATVADRGDHPIVHVSWSDADAYCAWAGLRLPTEAEWEYAARGGLAGRRFPWGDELQPGGQHRMNVWQGDFPQRNECADGWYGTCPVDTYEPNGFGLYNTTGNVWEWCRDWFDNGRRSARGGSYLCHESYCGRYRVDGRQGIAPDSSIGNTGFRCARDP